jgi:hypothetical protein
MGAMRISLLLCVLGGILMLASSSVSLSSCSTTPAGTEVESEDNIETVREDVKPKAIPKKKLQRPDAPRIENPVRPLRYKKKVKGGAITFTVDATPEVIAEIMLDFGKPTARRAWTKKTELIKRDGDSVDTHWMFEGKVGIYPKCDINFTRTATEKNGVLIRFKQIKAGFAMAAFFGDYRIEPKGNGKSEVTMRVFLDSGLWIANVSDADITEALQADGALLQIQVAEVLAQ